MVREALRLMEAEDLLRAAKLAQLRHDIQEGLQSGRARPWNVAEMSLRRCFDSILIVYQAA